jgi:hypothetical protein
MCCTERLNPPLGGVIGSGSVTGRSRPIAVIEKHAEQSFKMIAAKKGSFLKEP